LPAARSVRTGHRPDVEGMRAVAVGLVVAYHAGWGLFGGGFVGVDVFFVLSGFLITGLLADELQRSGSLSFVRFYGRRIRRLLPMSALVLISTAVAFSFVISPLDRPALTGDIRSAVFYIANWHFAGQALNYQTDPSSSPVLHFWSLGVEEQFYIVWPLLLILVAGRAARRHDPEGARRRMFAALAVLAIASFVVSVVLTGRSASAYYGLHTRAWELAAGGLLALGLPWVTRLPRAALALGGWIGLAVVVGSAIVMGATTPFPGSAAAVPVLGTVLMIAAGVGTTADAGVSRLLSASWLTYVGRISYGWYLWHWPCLIFVRVLSGASITANDVGVTVHVWAGWTVLAVVVSFGLASVSHHVLENPVRRSTWLAAAGGRDSGAAACVVVGASADGDRTGVGPWEVRADHRAGPAEPVPCRRAQRFSGRSARVLRVALDDRRIEQLRLRRSTRDEDHRADRRLACRDVVPGAGAGQSGGALAACDLDEERVPVHRLDHPHRGPAGVLSLHHLARIRARPAACPAEAGRRHRGAQQRLPVADQRAGRIERTELRCTDELGQCVGEHRQDVGDAHEARHRHAGRAASEDRRTGLPCFPWQRRPAVFLPS
jgi:peptidoglycan/LPS O-acetylase OafA/YrhL